MFFIVTVTVNWAKNNSKNNVYVQTIEIKMDSYNFSLTSASNLAAAISIMKNKAIKILHYKTKHRKGDNIQQSYAKRNLVVKILILTRRILGHC